MIPDKLEVLAPAGGPEALRAAVFAGADAVYLGGPAFGARAAAKNFSREELRQAVAFCHARDTAVHVTVNTLLKDRELPTVLGFVEFLCSLPVDAVLVQDLGLLSLLRRQAPDLPLHASTQMGLHTAGGVKLAEQWGIRRAVLARELSLEETRRLGADCSIELESFIHGALCMSVSGQCYFSAVLGGRSGNRGQCAQTCRLPFAAPGGTGHDLSLKDLSLIGEAEALRRAGVCSVKIEGRMKRPEYVAAATSACRLAADGGEVPETLSHALKSVFSRSGFTDGYYTGRLGREMFGVRTREDVEQAGTVLISLRELYRGEMPRVPVRLELSQDGGRLTLVAEDRRGNRETASAEATGGILSSERCVQQLEKTGGTPFFAEQVSVPETGVQAAVSIVNALRREVLEVLLHRREQRPAIPFVQRALSFAPHPKRCLEEPLPLWGSFRKADQVCTQAKQLAAIALPLETAPEDLDRLRDAGFSRIMLDLPRASFGSEERTEALLVERMEQGFTECVAWDLGGLWIGKKLGARLHGGPTLNVTNSAALAFLREQGLTSVEVSWELSTRELAALGDKLPRGLVVYGRIPVMLTRNCPLANAPGGCRHCREPGVLTDRTGRRFPVLCSGQGPQRVSEVFNCVPLWLWDKPLQEMDFGVLRFTVENSVEIGRILEACFRQEPLGFDYTRGLFARGVE